MNDAALTLSRAAGIRASLHRAALHYGGGLVLHTASSGSVASLEALYLRLEEAGQCGTGEVRINCAYLNGYAAEQIVDEALKAIGQIDWSQGAHALFDSLGALIAPYGAPVRTLIDSALHDLRARQLGISVAALYGAAQRAQAPSWRTNQTLFWSSDDAMLARAAQYLDRGFRDLKLRVGVAHFDDDLRRIDLLHSRFGARLTLSVDANGQWRPEDCATRFAALAARGVDYVEQPIAAGDWDALRDVARASPITLMLDESLQSPADIDALCALAGLPVAAHLKLLKLGGIAATVAAARKLQAAGVALMIGQMNEGALATAAALQACCACGPRWAELYGADGLVDDPARGIVYRDGGVNVTDPHGLGVSFDAALTTTL
ncbi:L-alanine-DL-glutamate epimerase-like enolase superfamily enzyme [Paraburkholderia tropica]|uniref:mandelate racemase/muconate lactonizing enzyme family protein n=1 Tax=Paraburkholderia tropica TaxID=92647 RepID=UPI0017FAA4C4|nr:enolase C-terminal domain-like protein [Paraburkholderia tropica]MBB3001641.1 L-alanine-DL-glutamate epimerase-like enolase superfamily enzyme [Paraburkholderia tropica]MBB6321163.1 L-alanine-DL-glutamate epimerase-like enolase superfamily enzyme [Paraburkholderia tropica]